LSTLGSSRKPLFQRSQSRGLRALVLALAALSLIAVDLRGDRVESVRTLAMQLMTPLLLIAELPAELQRYAALVLLHADQEREIERLREERLILEARLQRNTALESENRRLRELLSSSEELDERVLVAEILAANQDPYRQQLLLNRGRQDGVYRGQALVDAAGVLGQIVRVHARTSTALLITDPDHGIPVELDRTGLQTIAIGRGDGLGLSLPFLPGNADIRVGDLLVSSALGGRFPSGYPVAEVTELRYQPGESFMEAMAIPKARINQGRQVLLIWGQPLADDAGDPAEAPADPGALVNPPADGGAEAPASRGESGPASAP
jgi:rod shape-determining protein MreC